MSSIELKSRAKINLSIDVLGKREDGYHLVEMIMQTIDLYDIIKIKEIEIDESTVLTKLFERILKEQNEGNKLILSQETAGTEDNFLVDLAVAANITMILVENRESAYYTVLNNRLLQLEEKIGG